MSTKLIGYFFLVLGCLYLFFFIIPNGSLSNIKHIFNVAALTVSGIALIAYKPH